MKKISKILLMSLLITSSAFSAFSLTSCGDENEVVEQEENNEELYLYLTKTTLTFNNGVTRNTIVTAVKESVKTNATNVSVLDVSTEIGTHKVTVKATLDSNTITKIITVVIKGEENLVFNISKSSFEFVSGVTETNIKSGIEKCVTTNGNLTYSAIDINKTGTQTVVITSTKGKESKVISITINIKGEENLVFDISKSSFEFDTTATISDIKSEIEKYVTTNGTLSYSTIEAGKTGTQTILVTSFLGSKGKSLSVTINIKEKETDLVLNITKTSFEFDATATISDIKTEIEKYVTTNGTLSYSTIEAGTIGTQTIFVTSSLGLKSKSLSITINIKGPESNLVFDISKSSFEFDTTATVSDIKTEIEKYVTTNGTLSYSAIEAGKTGTQTIFVTSSLGLKSKSLSITINIKGPESNLVFDISKSSFEFDTTATVSDIKTEIEKYVTTNGTLSYSAIEAGKTGTQTIFVTSSLGLKSKSSSVTINIKDNTELVLEISKTSFNFIFEATVSDIKSEIEKYVTTNGTLSYSTIEVGKAGEQIVVIYATKGNNTVFKTVKINIDEEIIVNLNISKTEFEFPLGVSLSNIKEYISSFITTNGTVAFRNLSTSVGSYNVIVDSIIEHKIVSKNISVSIKGNDDVALELKKTSFEFLYGATAEDMILEIADYAITNGSLEIINMPTECGTHNVVLKAVNNGKESTKTISITINPNSKGLNFTKIATKYSSTELKIEVTIVNNTGKEISGVGFNILIHDGTYVRAAFSKDLEFPITYGSSQTLKNGETNVISLVLKYNSNFKAVPISSYIDGSVSTAGYDYNWISSVSSYSWRYSYSGLVYKD